MNELIARQKSAQGLTRRFLLKGAVALFGAVSVSSASEASAADFISVKGFKILSEILVSRPQLDEIVAHRAMKGLTMNDPAFPQKAAALMAAIRAENFHDMSQFDVFIRKYPTLKSVAMSTISAWYLGFCGTYDEHLVPAVGHPVDSAQFVSYAAALMYAPTIDATVIPSYSRGRTNYWFYPPKTLATD